jgi:DNA-binding response OmpR family regulator
MFYMRETVLIIEDDPTLLRGLRDNFEMRGYQVETAADGLAGVTTALDGAPDLIVLDIMLPKMNGYEICQAIRARDVDVPIIMLTAKGQEEDIVRGLELGADDYVTKPFSVRELLARANALLRRRRIKQPDIYRFGDCEFDILSCKLTVKGNEVPLTHKELCMLQFLLERAGRALTRKEIMANVWGHRVTVTSRSVDRCITTLRSKIEPVPGQPTFIKTIRDIGYRFELPQTEENE